MAMIFLDKSGLAILMQSFMVPVSFLVPAYRNTLGCFSFSASSTTSERECVSLLLCQLSESSAKC